MLSDILTVSEQVLILFVMIGVGVVMCRIKLLTDNGIAQINNLLINVVSPCVVIKAFQIDRNSVSLSSMGLSTLMAVGSMGVSILIAGFFFNKEEDGVKRVLKCAAAYPNCGFMGLPLVQALLGSTGVIYASIFISIMNIFNWTHCYNMLGNAAEKKSLVKIIFNPGTVAILIGLPMFLLSWHLPKILYTPVDAFAALNTPVAMVSIGAYISSAKLSEAFRDGRLYKVCSIKLLLIPAVVLGLLYIVHPDYVVFATCIIQISAPCAGMVAIFSSAFGRDAVLASKAVAVSTLFSILTMPVFTALVGLVC